MERFPVKLLVAAIVALMATSPLAAQAPQLRVTLLGTGTPMPRADRL